jgi:hypothetical protein
MTNWLTQEKPDEEENEPEKDEDEGEFPQKLFVTMDKSQDEGTFPVANLTLEEAIATEREPVAVAEYVLNKHFKARLKVEVLEDEE